jgi:hypothetical protein
MNGRGRFMVAWDDYWTKVLVSVIAACLGAIVVGVVNAYASRQKIKEVELQYKFKLRDGYLENARKLTEQVYIPINIALTDLYNSYEKFIVSANTDDDTIEKTYREDCGKYLKAIDDLFRRGADAYLTNSIDETLNGFTNFVRNSLEAKEVTKRQIFQPKISALGFYIFDSPAIERDYIIPAKASSWRTQTQSLSFGVGGLHITYNERTLAAPIKSDEYQTRLRTEVPVIKSLIKEVTLGYHPSRV